MNVRANVKTQKLTEIQEKELDFYTLVLYNDDFNTFDHVIECLVSICKHDSIQAQQCAYLVHYTGKSDIKSGEISELETYKQALIDQRLSVVIEKVN
jgi:ATP-dependent Clp protease adaptor protein ClpS